MSVFKPYNRRRQVHCNLNGAVSCSRAGLLSEGHLCCRWLTEGMCDARCFISVESKQNIKDEKKGSNNRINATGKQSINCVRVEVWGKDHWLDLKDTSTYYVRCVTETTWGFRCTSRVGEHTQIRIIKRHQQITALGSVLTEIFKIE